MDAISDADFFSSRSLSGNDKKGWEIVREAVYLNSRPAFLVQLEILIQWAQPKHANRLRVTLAIDDLAYFCGEII